MKQHVYFELDEYLNYLDPPFHYRLSDSVIRSWSRIHKHSRFNLFRMVIIFFSKLYDTDLLVFSGFLKLFYMFNAYAVLVMVFNTTLNNISAIYRGGQFYWSGKR